MPFADLVDDLDPPRVRPAEVNRSPISFANLDLDLQAPEPSSLAELAVPLDRGHARGIEVVAEPDFLLVGALHPIAETKQVDVIEP